MRDILTGLAIILIVALTTMLVAPYFVDWNGQRGFLEAQLSKALGQKVTIGGTIDLKLLPTPYIRLNQTVIGGDEGPLSIGIHHLDLELSVAPLLHGEFDIVEGRLDEPTIRLTLQQDRTLPALPDTPAFHADVRLERITVADGTLAIADPASGRTFVFDHLDFTTDAPSLSGPFRGAGAGGAEVGRTNFRFSTTAAKKGRSRLHLALGETTTHPGLDLDGDLALTGGDGGALQQSFDGSLTAIGHVFHAADKALAWRLSGPLRIEPQSATLAKGELRLGGEEAGLSLAADIKATFTDTTRLAASLSAPQLDIDRLSGAPVDAKTPPPTPRLPSFASLRRLATEAMPPVPTSLDVAIDAATWGGETLSGLALKLAPKDGGGTALQVAGDGPGGLHLALDGLIPDGGGSFQGTGALGATALPQALGWIASVAPDLVASPRALPFDEAGLSGRFAIGADRFDAREATLRIDRSKLTGAIGLAYGDDGKPGRVSADLHSAMLDIDALPSLDLAAREASKVDLDLKLDADRVAIAKLGSGPVEAGHLAVDLSRQAGRLTLRSLRLAGLGGADVTASGRVEPRAATLLLDLDADRLDQAAALVLQLAPGPWADALSHRAGSLAPAHLKIDAGFAAGSGDALEPSRLTLSGTLAATQVDATLAPPGSTTTESVLKARAEASDGAALLRQIGLPTIAAVATTGTIGRGAVTLDAHGAIDQSMETTIAARVGATAVDVAGRFDLFGTAHGGSGRMTIKSPDLAPLLRDLALVSPDLKARVPSDVTGGLAIGQAGLALTDLKGTFGDTGLNGTLKIAPASGDAATLTGALDLDRLSLGTLAALALGPTRPPASGSAWSSEPFAAGLVDPPRTSLSLRSRAFDLAPGLSATDARFDLDVAPGVVAMSHAEASLAGGSIAGRFTLRRDGRQASLEGSLKAETVALDRPAIHAGVTGSLDVAGGGATAAALVGSLAGSGAATLAAIRVPGADPGALPKVFAEVEDDTFAVDDETVARALEAAANAPLVAGTRDFALGLATGTLSLTEKGGPVGARSPSPPVSTSLAASFDLRAPTLTLRATETLNALPKDWSGSPPAITIVQSGPLSAPRRRIDVAAFLDGVAARAIARESARIETYEFDIRERALFNARLQSDRRREQDRLKAESDAKAAVEAARRAAELARKAEAERRARAEAERQDKLQDKLNADVSGGAPPAAGTAPPPRQRFEAPPPGALSDPTAAGRY